MPEAAYKSNAFVEIPMHITKAVMDGKAMKWQATNSDTDPDSYLERMSMELYQDFIERIVNKEPVPDIFKSYVCSDYWNGGMPYLSVSHYPDLNGHAVPGDVVKLYVDGNKLKAKGTLYSTPLGHSVFRALQADKNKNPEEKIRISIGFLDLAHKHGNGEVWVRESLTSICPDCLNGVGDKVYVKGYLVHLALTRVPVNKRTEMLLEEKSMSEKKTRQEDAASIVGEVLASEIEIKNKATALKSDVLIEMSEGEETVTEEKSDTVEAVAESPVETPAETPVVEESVAQAPEVLASSTDPRGYTETEKSNPVEEKMDASMLPYSGAVSMKDAKKARDTMEEMEHVMDLWGMFSNVAWNIIDRGDVTDKKAAFVKALDEFKSMLAAKAMVEFSQATPVVEKSGNVHELKPALDALLSAVDNSLTFEGDVVAKLQSVNPSLQELGTAITDYVTRKSVVSNEPPALVNKNNDNLLEEITKIIQPLSESVRELRNQVGVLEAKSVGQAQTKSRIPQPRSAQIKPDLIQKSTTEPVKPGSIKDIVRKSVGLDQ